MIAGDLALAREIHLTRAQWLRAALIGVCFIASLGAVLAIQPLPDSPRLELGKVSPKTILAPERVTFASQAQTQDARAKAEALVKDVYDAPDANLARERVRLTRRVFEYVDTVRHDPYSDAAAKLEWVQAIPNVALPTLTLTRTLGADENLFHRLVTETLYVVDGAMREEIRPPDFAAAVAKLPSRVSLALAVDEADLVAQWARLFISPNSFFNPQRTAEQRAIARERVGTVYRAIEKGEAVVREGEVVTALAWEALDALGILRARVTTLDDARAFLLAALLAAYLLLYLWRFRRALIAYPRALGLIAFLLVAAAAAAKGLIGEVAALGFLLPVAAAPMLIAVLIDPLTALASTIPVALILGFAAPLSLELTLYALLGGIVGAITLTRIERASAFLKSGAIIAAMNAGMIVVVRFGGETDGLRLAQELLAGVANGALAGLIALGSVLILGRVFGITTSMDLFDLARPTHPLLQKLLRDAPGTYHHSLIVSQLAEQAAQSIGADALLVRVGAYYHDVGKSDNPHAFIENQLDGVNIHDTLDPHTSAAIVIDHIASGLALTARYHLPARLREFIPQHHGTTLAAYFFRHASATTPVNENDFRYPGPKPQSREAAILMLADSVEATARAERPATPEKIRELIARIVAERLREGQLDECDLTLRDLPQIQNAFASVLQGLFHPRIKYPEVKAQTTDDR